MAAVRRLPGGDRRRSTMRADVAAQAGQGERRVDHLGHAGVGA